MNLLRWMFWRDVAAAYRRVFNAPDAQIVLADLAKFCRATQTSFDRDPNTAAFRAGRQDVWHRINGFINLSPAAIADLKPSESKRDDNDFG